jgi:DHA1 family inner membrane transport protein
MFTGLTLANVLGVPLGTALGQEAGWRSTFWAVTVIGVIALIGLIRFLPAKRDEEKLDMRAELRRPQRRRHLAVAEHDRAVRRLDVHPLHLRRAAARRCHRRLARGVTWTLLLIGLGLTVGNIIGGKLADKAWPPR